MSVEPKTEVKNTFAEASMKMTDRDAADIVRRNSLWAMGVGLIPVPGVDLLGVTAVQVKMVSELSRVYGVEFSEHRVKSILGALAGGLGALAGAPILFSLIKIVPIVGQTAGLVSLPLSAGAFTYAVGQVFTQHFIAGGNLLNFDAAKVREHFRKEFEAAKQTVKEMQKEKEHPASKA